MERTGGVNGGKGCQEVILGSFYCWFYRVELMVVGLNELDVGIDALDNFLMACEHSLSSTWSLGAHSAALSSS